MQSAFLAFLLLVAPAQATLPTIEEVLLSAVPAEAKAKLPTKPTLDQLASALPAEAKPGVIEKLGALHDAAVKQRDEPTILELGQAFYALKDYERAGVAGVQSVQLAPKKTDGVLLAGLAYRNSGDYEAATNAAKMALKIDPNDKRAQDLYAFSQGRASKTISPSPKKPTPPSGTPTNAPGSGFAFTPLSKKNLAPPPAPSGASDVKSSITAYVVDPAAPTPNPSNAQLLSYLVRDFLQWPLSLTRGKTLSDIEGLKREIEKLPSTQELAGQMGGWNKLWSSVEFRAGLADNESLAVTRERLPWERPFTSKPIIIAIQKDLTKIPEEISIPIISHEIAHAVHKSRGYTGLGTQIASEYGAHRTEVLAFEDSLKTTDPSRRRLIAEKIPLFDRNKFHQLLWQDRLTRRFSRAEFVNQFHTREYREMAYRAYRDLETGRTTGAEHLDFHVYLDKVEGVYRKTPFERDLDMIPSNEVTPEMRQKRETLMKEVKDFDARSRKAYGYELK